MGRAEVRIRANLSLLAVILVVLLGAGLCPAPTWAADRGVSSKTFEASAAHGVGTEYSSGVLVGSYSEGLLLVSVSGVSGTPTARLVAETSEDDDTYFYHSAIASVDAAGATAYPITNFGKYLRLKQVITGGASNDTITYQVKGIFKN